MATIQTGGRGGAGNIKSSSTPQETVKADDLQTPTIKQSTYTTGRGGAGNMASNDTPDGARKAQDVDTPAAHKKEMKGTYHWGRGGEGNKTTIGEDERVSSRSPARKGGPQGERRRSSMKDKAQEMLGFGRGEKEKRQSESAVAIEDD